MGDLDIGYGNPSCLDFHGGTDFQRVSIGTDTDYCMDNDMTFSFWMYPRAWGNPNCNCGDERATLFVRGTNNQNEYEFTQTKTGTLNFYMNDAGAGGSIVTTDTVPINVWTHLAVTYDYDTPTLKIYINGDLSKEGTPKQLSEDSQTFYIAGESTNCSDAVFSGSIIDFRIFNSTLNDGGIKQVYTGSNPVNPISWWKFDDEEGSTLTDFIENNDGTIVGATWASNYRYINCNCSRWDANNYSLTLETWLNKSQLKTLRNYIIPGATGDLYTILGRPHHYDKTWTADNTIRIIPNDSYGSTLDDMRSEKVLFVKNISDTPLEGTSGWLNVKLECLLSGSSDM